MLMRHGKQVPHAKCQALSWCCIAAAMLLPAVVAAGNHPTASAEEGHRRQFLKALHASNQEYTRQFERLTQELREYPLYPYLLYRRVKRRQATYVEVRDFILAYPDFPDNAHLLERWLPHLAAQGRWDEFLEIHDPGTKSERLRCLALQAGAGIGRLETELAEETAALFLSGKSRHPACDPAFRRLYSMPGADELVLARIDLALGANRVGLARYLSRRLDVQLRPAARRLIQAHQAPLRVLSAPGPEDTAMERAAQAHAVTRLAARGRLDQAIKHWRSLLERYTYATEQRQRTARSLARRALLKQHPAVFELLEEAGPLDQQLLEWRLVATLRARDWARLADWTRAIPGADAEVNRLQWLYWHARATEALGRAPAAHVVYRELAKERDYYGFLAADRMDLPYSMTHVPVNTAPELLQAVADKPAMQRAREWFQLGEKRRALREWHRALRDMQREELEASAYLTTSWGWHDRAIFALGRAKSYDDLGLRFPVLHEAELREAADQHGLNPGWVFAKVRAESAFAPDARSPAGALGLMQLMPMVGRSMARLLKLRNYSTSRLFDADTNIRLGSAYLADLYQEFGGNVALATGAYNAGPHRIRTWLGRWDCTETDAWIELIPFQETRLHVKRVLFYTAVYDWLLEHNPTRISRHMYSSNRSLPFCEPRQDAHREADAERES